MTERTTPASAEAHPHHLTDVVADRRGVTAAGAVAIALVLGIIGAAIDVRTGAGLRSTFAGFFIAGCALAALICHHEDLGATIVMPPLVYVVLAAGASALRLTETGGGSRLREEVLQMATALTADAPVLIAAVASALAVAVVRGLRQRARTAPTGRRSAAR